VEDIAADAVVVGDELLVRPERWRLLTVASSTAVPMSILRISGEPVPKAPGGHHDLERASQFEDAWCAVTAPAGESQYAASSSWYERRRRARRRSAACRQLRDLVHTLTLLVCAVAYLLSTTGPRARRARGRERLPADSRAPSR
jgi:hypothetical protein